MRKNLESAGSTRRTAEKLRDSTDFELLLGEVSSRLLAVPLERLDDEIRSSLQKLILFFGADRGSIGRVMPDGTVQATHTWATEGIPPAPSGPLSALPNYSELIRRGEPIVARTVDELPEDWHPELEYVR